MFTKLLFIDDDGDLMMDYALSAYICKNHHDQEGVMILITDDCGIWYPYQKEPLIKQLFNEDKVDLTHLGRAVWIDENDNWSDDPDEDDDDKEEETED